jgi:hypothetical protein
VKFTSLVLEGNIVINNIIQWKLFKSESFQNPPTGWTDNSISTCGYINMLGGYGKFSGGEISKVFDEIPLHSKIRILANYHFIDAWSGESAFMRVNNGKK